MTLRQAMGWLAGYRRQVPHTYTPDRDGMCGICRRSRAEVHAHAEADPQPLTPIMDMTLDDLAAELNGYLAEADAVG